MKRSGAQWYKSLYSAWFVLKDKTTIPHISEGDDVRVSFRCEGLDAGAKIKFFIAGREKTISPSGYPATVEFRANEITEINYTQQKNKTSGMTTFTVLFRSSSGRTSGLTKSQPSPDAERLRAYMASLTEPHIVVHFKFNVSTKDAARDHVEDDLETIKECFEYSYHQYRSPTVHTAMTTYNQTIDRVEVQKRWPQSTIRKGACDRHIFRP